MNFAAQLDGGAASADEMAVSSNEAAIRYRMVSPALKSGLPRQP
jgi:hypothetical protein